MKMPCRITDEKVIPGPCVEISKEELLFSIGEQIETAKYWTDWGLPLEIAEEVAKIVYASDHEPLATVCMQYELDNL